MPSDLPGDLPNNRKTVVILGTGGTIAGTAASATDNVGYVAAQRGVAELVAAVPALATGPIEAAQVAQLDSKDMDHATWQRLALAAQQHLARPDVAGVVVTHGTDTLEETAYFLHHVLALDKPLVLTAAMRPATALGADGPQNLLDAVAVARHPGARGVLAVLAGQVHAGLGLRKSHTYRLNAFDSGDSGPLAAVEEGALRVFRAWPEAMNQPGTALTRPPQDWPWVEVLSSHAGARPQGVAALVAAGVQGLVLATTGNGTVHQALVAALDDACAAGVRVWRSTRCAQGVVVGATTPTGGPGGVADPLPAVALTPWQARVALMLALMDEKRLAGAGKS